MMVMDGDVVFDSSFRPVAGVGAQKCAQDIGEALLTEFNQVRSQGSELITAQMRGKTANLTPGQVDMYVRNAVQRLMDAQGVTPRQLTNEYHK